MKLLRLHLQGFKSFKDKTTIHFDDGITGIVGPNGCGKSNIVDALFWVMGEQSAKHLRGTKMKDLIFAGSSKYTPATFAEVTLVLENDTGKHIHIGNQVSKPSEIALTRKLYRNGETEYRINNIPARLKDIQEVFMDTGAGAKSYSIIAQGEINRLVQAKPVERRVMIEEVAGITKFKMRKRESLKKIEQTTSNLNRLNDLQSEIYKQLKALERQAEKAEKAKRLRSRVKHHELIVKSHKEFDFLTNYVNANNKLQSNAEEVEKASLAKDQLELTLEDERIKKVDLTEKIDLMQGEFNELSKELAASEERLKHLVSTCEDKEKHISEREAENTEIQKDIEERTNKLNELEQKLADLKEQNLNEIDFSEQEERVEFLKEELQTKEETLKDLQNSLEVDKEEFKEIDQTVFRNNSKLEEYSSQLEDIGSEIEEIETTNANASDELIKLRTDSSVATEKWSELKETHAKTKAELEQARQELKAKDKEQRELSRETIQLESKLNSLKELNKTGEGIRKGAVEFLNDDESNRFEILGNIIECEPEYAKALEVLFEDSFDALIASSSDHDKVTNWAGAHADKSLDFLSTQTSFDKCSPETVERLRIQGCTDVVAIEDILKINNAEFKESLSQFFNGFYIVKDLSAELATKVASALNIKGLVSQDGNVYVVKTLNGSKLSVRSENDSTMGVVQRNNLINEMTGEFEAKTSDLNTLEDAINVLTTQVEELSAQEAEQAQALNEAYTQHISLKSSLDSKEASNKTVSSRFDILTNRKNEISKLKLELLENEEDILNQKDDLEQKIEAATDQYEMLKSECEEIRSTYETERSELLDAQASAKTFHVQIDNFQSQISDANDQIKRYQDKLTSNTELLERYANEIEAAKAGMSALEESNATQAEALSDRENVLNLVKDELSSLLLGMQDREKEVKELTSKINTLEKNNVELNMKVEQIVIDEDLLVRDCFDRYKVDLRDILMKHLEYSLANLEGLTELSAMYEMEGEEGVIKLEAEEYKFDKKFPAALKESKEKYKRYRSELNRLGEINWQAIEDYDRQKLRYDFLREQEQELKKSIEDLETAIAHIDEKSKKRFKEAYDEVNIRFTKVFPIIFGGGEARLEITGDVDSDECGIDIIAKPPGKKMQSINLMSGGEKAMTAVSLIFSIFLVKPSPFCLLDEVDAPLDDANVGRFNELLREMSSESQFILITHNKKTMELNDMLYGVTMQEPGVSKAISVQLH
ncbi:MAG: chromosome segregation protein SMC [Halobacteriovoraceae bacterium]|nr:chromosome segregation protein SMC [Halobacteriovoraceae bacterium]|tara:strand:+ start:11430 stop:15116 length:3687 start_codon:yes stop_codon:yes gene_type:complete